MDDIIKKTIRDYKIAKKMGKQEEILTYQATIKQLKFAKQHMIRVLNMDFEKPTAKLRKMAKEANIDLQNPVVLEEFKVIQEQTLNDIKRLRNGEKPMTEEESQAERTQMIKERRDKLYNEAVEKQKKETEMVEKQKQKLVEQLKSSKTAPVEQKPSSNSSMDKILLGAILLAWISIMVYTNYFIEDD